MLLVICNTSNIWYDRGHASQRTDNTISRKHFASMRFSKSQLALLSEKLFVWLLEFLVCSYSSLNWLPWLFSIRTSIFSYSQFCVLPVVLGVQKRCIFRQTLYNTMKEETFFLSCPAVVRTPVFQFNFANKFSNLVNVQRKCENKGKLF